MSDKPSNQEQGNRNVERPPVLSGASTPIPPVIATGPPSKSPTFNPQIPPSKTSKAIQPNENSPPIRVIENLEVTQDDLDDEIVVAERKRSWVFRLLGQVSIFCSHLFGIASVIFLLAVGANLPIIQFMSFGYLLEVSGRLARKQKFRDAMIGLQKASKVGSIVLGTWLVLLPVRLLSSVWFESYLVDPASSATRFLRFAQVATIVLAILHIASVWICGGKLRYFLWPLIAPASFALWTCKKVLGSNRIRRVLRGLTNWLVPGLIDDLLETKPIGDWFLPAILMRNLRRGNNYARARDSVWDFVMSTRPWYYLGLGFWGFIGTFLWLLVPTSLLVIASFSEGGLSILSGVLGTLLAIPVFAILPYLQTHYARSGRLSSFLGIRTIWNNFCHAPFAHAFSLLITLVLAIPLFLLKIEQIPPELLWTLSVVFVVFSWPSRMIVGWAYRRSLTREKRSRWWVRYPIATTIPPISLAFVLILTLTRYISWYGAFSLFENHVFLLPAPFWL